MVEIGLHQEIFSGHILDSSKIVNYTHGLGVHLHGYACTFSYFIIMET